ncbi:hypothetical protein JOB18_031729 [Solea senegalensis]|nr:hypothetical protein JOB18_031729 [Solea senegalensis]
MLDILAENPRGLDALIDSIREMRTQNFIVTKITDEVQKAKNEKMESLRDACSSSSDSNLSSLSTTSDLPTSFSNNSTMLFHPEGEQSSSTSSDVARSLNLPSLQKGGDLSSVASASIHVVSSSTSSSLPRPGDPGAPPLPDEVVVESPSSIDVASPGCTSSGGDPNFQPLRSRSLTPMSQKNIF